MSEPQRPETGTEGNAYMLGYLRERLVHDGVIAIATWDDAVAAARAFESRGAERMRYAVYRRGPLPVARLLRVGLDKCTEEVSRARGLEPCDSTAVALRYDDVHDGEPYPVCARHSRGGMVPLAALVADVLESGGSQ